MACRAVIVIDDGIATDATIRAALRAIRTRKPGRLVLAMPVAPTDRLTGRRLIMSSGWRELRGAVARERSGSFFDLPPKGAVERHQTRASVLTSGKFLRWEVRSIGLIRAS